MKKMIELTEEQFKFLLDHLEGEIDSMAKWVEEPAQEYVLKMRELKKALENATTL